MAFGICVLSFTVILLLLMAAAAARYSNVGISENKDACAWTDWRLPPWARPTSYDLMFQVTMQDPWDVLGEAKVDVTLKENSRCIVMHAKGMEILRASLVGESDKVPVSIRKNDTLEQVTFEWAEFIGKGQHVLQVSYQYSLSEGMTGFYRSSYEEEGNTEVIAATQFEANSARTAFPCFDEPEFKAVFAIEVITSKDLHVLSNMPPKAVHHVRYF